MILHELKNYLEAHGTVSQRELAHHFHMSEDGVDAMLGVWMKKGVISRFVDTNRKDQTTKIRYRMNQNQGLSLTAIM
jgi:putative ferrous iron transport protein C